MSLGTEYVKWVSSLSEDELREYRFELYDAAEIADHSSELYTFIRTVLPAVMCLEREYSNRRMLAAGGTDER